MKINKAIYILSCLLLSIFLFGCKESQLKITVFDKLPDSPLLNEVKSSIDDKKPLAIAFTAEWCPHCRKYKPIFIEVQDGYKDRITFINIDVDDTNGQTITQRFQVKGIPTTAFIRPDGSVFKVQVGNIEKDDLNKFLDSLIKSRKKKRKEPLAPFPIDELAEEKPVQIQEEKLLQELIQQEEPPVEVQEEIREETKEETIEKIPEEIKEKITPDVDNDNVYLNK